MKAETLAFMRFAVDHGLTEGQAGQVSAWMRALWDGVESVIATADQLDADERASLNQGLGGMFGQGPQGKWYELTKLFLNPSVVRYVDNLLAQPG